MNKGYIRIYRQIQDNPLWFSESFTKAQAWIDILLITNHKKNSFYLRGNEIKVERGQFAYGELELAKRWKWSRNKVRRYLNWLETIQQMKQQKNRVLSIYTVLNYDIYQADDTTNETSNDTTERQQKVQQKDINNNDNNDNNVKNIIIITNKIEFEKTFIEEMKTKFPLVNVENQLERARDWLASTGKHYKDYKAFFRNWLRNAKPVRRKVIQL